MITVRKSAERRHIGTKNQKSWMTFDSENQSDPLQNGFYALKILNEEMHYPGSEFILHTHKDMVTVTYVRDGVIIYKGPLEKSYLVEAKNFHRVDLTPDTQQYAFNTLDSDVAHVFQSGFTHSEGLLKPDGIKKLFTHMERQGIFKLIASSDGREASLHIHQDVQMYSTFIQKGHFMTHKLNPGRNAWLHVAKGQVLIGDLQFRTGDGAGFSDQGAVSFTAQEPTEILLFDLCGQIPEKIKMGEKRKLQTAKTR